jgi:hypothetical protein
MSKINPNKEIVCGSITIMPESDNRTLCVSLTGLIERGDYEECFFKPLQELVNNGIKFGLLIYYSKGYKGWTTEAADLSFQSIIAHGKHARKLAYVNPPESKIFQVKMAAPLLSGEVHYFEDKDLSEAIKWVKS